MTASSGPVAALALPSGVVEGDGVAREAIVRGLTGHDEEWLAELAGSPGAPRTTALLARTVERIGGTPVDQAVARSLTVGDRETLLWAIRTVATGTVVDLTIDCEGCGEKLDVPLDLDERRSATSSDRGAPAGVAISQKLPDGTEVLLRAPTGADQELVAATDATLEERAAALLAQVVESVDGRAPTAAELADLAEQLASVLADLDPSAETELRVRCPVCDHDIVAHVDAGTVVVEEAMRSARWLLEEVHAIAWHYHWSEAEILSLATARRRRYLELIDAAVAGGPT